MSTVIRMAEIIASQEEARLDVSALGDKFSLWSSDDNGDVAPSLLIFRELGGITLEAPIGPINFGADIARGIARELVDLADQLDGRGRGMSHE